MAEKNLSIKLSLNDKQFQSALRKSTRSIQTFGNKMKTFGDSLNRNITLPVVALGGAAVKLASDFEETQSKFNTVFRDISDSAKKSADDLKTNYGLSSRASMQLLSDTGDLLTGFGFTQEEALKLSTEVNKLAVDLASFTNFSGGAEGASLALTKALLGERESIKQLGIAITETDLKAFAESQGLVWKEMGRVEKANLTFQLALTQSKNAIGDFQRTADSFANSLRTMKALIEDNGVSIGKELLPVAKGLVEIIKDLLNFSSQFTSEQKQGAIEVAGYAAGFSILYSVLGRVIVIFGSLRKFILGSFVPAMRTLMTILANFTPAGRVITGILLAATYIYSNWESLVTLFNNLTQAVKDYLVQLGILEKKPPLDFSKQDTSNLPTSKEDFIKRTASYKGVKIVPKPKKPQISEETRKGIQAMNEDKQRWANMIPLEPIKVLNVELSKIPETLETIDATFEDTMTKMERMAIMVSSTFRNAFMDMADASESSQEDIIKAAKNAAREQIKIAIASAVAEYAAKIFQSVPFPLNLALAAAAGTVVGGLFSKIIPPFAEGGLVTGATIGMIGEGPGTSMSNPEVIAPLDKLKSYIGEGGGNVQVYGTLSGADILLSSDRARNNRNRTRGY